MFKIIVTVLLLSFNLFPQIIDFSEKKLEYFYNPVSFPEYDSIMVYNTGSDLLVIDSIYSKSGYGYKLNLDSASSNNNYYIFTGYNSLFISLEPNDSVRFIFSYPDFCPICKKQLDITAFSDTLVFHSNSLTNNYSFISVEGDGSTDIKNDYDLLDDFALYQNYPNPFNPSTVISWQLTVRSHVSLKVYDILGNEVAILVNEEKSPGNYQVEFNAESASGGLSSGIYFYELTVIGAVKSYHQTRKMVLLR